MHICRAVISIALSSAFSSAVAHRPAVTSHVTVIARDRKWLVLNSEGKLWRLAVAGGEPELIPTGSVKGINNDHGISADGKQLAISAGQIFVLPFAGGTPRQVTEKAPSYFHGWSPNGRSLVYCARRDNNSDRAGSWDIWRIPAEGAGVDDAGAQRITSDRTSCCA